LEEQEPGGTFKSSIAQISPDIAFRYLAILAGRLGLTVPQLKEEFRQLIARILAGPISSDELDEFLKDLVKRYMGSADTPMFDPSSQTSHCKTYVWVH
jgi:hypothetical protein